MIITTNQDKEYVKNIRNRLRQNDNHCPCNLIKDDTTICMCKDFVEQKTSGWCHCNLYHKAIEEGDFK